MQSQPGSSSTSSSSCGICAASGLCSVPTFNSVSSSNVSPIFDTLAKALARDPSASLEDWQRLARTGEIVWFYNGRNRKKTGKILRNGHFGRAISESWLRP